MVWLAFFVMACSCNSCSSIQYTATIFSEDSETVLAEGHASDADEAVAHACSSYCQDQPDAVACAARCEAREGPSVEVSSNRWEIIGDLFWALLITVIDVDSCMGRMR
jgi:hypothetical protein